MRISIDDAFRRFVEDELLPAIDFEAGVFWSGLSQIIEDFSPENRRLLAVRDEMQTSIDEWHRGRAGQDLDAKAYRAFLEEIGYLEPTGKAFSIATSNVDREIANVPGPQLVVPVNNARFALNAANARWGSLYDALYGSDVIPADEGRDPSGQYNPIRGAAVIDYATAFLDRALPLATGSHADVARYALKTDGSRATLIVSLGSGSKTTFADNELFIGYRRDGGETGLLFRHNGLHVEIVVDPEDPVGRRSPAGVSDVLLESAVTVIQDCEDSVAAVDAADKVQLYRNWLKLMDGTLEVTFDKGGRSVTRGLNGDRTYTGVAGEPFELPGRSVMLVRNVGHLMTTDAVLDADGNEVFETILDCVVTSACAKVDLNGGGRYRNSSTGSAYIVKPKMHGSAEVAFADRLFSRVEDLLGLERNTLKIGVMDEERRTTVNLENCIRAVKDRLVFINTGFLDRTGDEIHTSMFAGPVKRKEAIKSEPWILAYEDWNVDIGIRCGLPGRAQIGKGMWPKPDEMRQMVETKTAHPEAGASCAWVPSPTAATLHALHYHDVDVLARQKELASRGIADLDAILTPPLEVDPAWSDDAIQTELDNNAQGILGYVVRWIDFGIGCSKVPDIDDVGLMEDRATLRISSQHIANWLEHGICSKEQVIARFRRMAEVVDWQNRHDPAYRPMAPDFDSSIAFCAARDLVLEGATQPNGYTEPLLHAHRRRRKAVDTS